jgi:hypothetical protein
MQSATIFYRRRLWDRGLLRLDSQYSYAADKDLILRIADSGAVIKHIPEYLAIFGIDGTNLSAHPEMRQEAERIRLAFGAFRSQVLRKLILIGRRVERLVDGGYRPASIRYLYAVDETPRYIEIAATKLGGRYSLDDIQRRAKGVSPVKLSRTSRDCDRNAAISPSFPVANCDPGISMLICMDQTGFCVLWSSVCAIVNTTQ